MFPSSPSELNGTRSGPPRVRRTLKPPGGDCHDLWGAEFNGTPSHQRVLKPPGGGSSDIFGQGAGGGVENSPRRVRNYVNSSQLFSDNAASSSSNTTSSSNGSIPNSNGTTASNKPDGNPVTGEGYSTPLQKSPPTSANSSNGEINGRQPPLRNRVPPGGFSSGLW